MSFSSMKLVSLVRWDCLLLQILHLNLEGVGVQSKSFFYVLIKKTELGFLGPGFSQAFLGNRSIFLAIGTTGHSFF